MGSGLTAAGFPISLLNFDNIAFVDACPAPSSNVVIIAAAVAGVVALAIIVIVTIVLLKRRASLTSAQIKV